MRIGRIGGRIIVLALLLVAAALSSPVNAARLVDPTFTVLQTKTGTYTNVTVTTLADTYIFIMHTNGMTSIKLTDLPVEVREELGYSVPKQDQPKKTQQIAVVAAREFTQMNKSLKPFEDKWRQQFHSQFMQLRRPAKKINSELLLTAVGIVVLFYLFFCHCCNLICLKAKQPSSFLVWLPILQWVPLLRAARMSAWWALAAPIPLVNLVVFVLWSVNIARARGKNLLCAILLIFPLTTLSAFLYLAFSQGSIQETPSPKFQTRSLQTA